MNRALRSAKERTKTLVEFWQAQLGLDWLTFKHNYTTAYDSDDPHTCACTEAYWQYRDVKFTWYLPAIARLDDDELEDVVVHEFVHSMIAPIEQNMDDDDADLCEFAVENVCRAFLHAVRPL